MLGALAKPAATFCLNGCGTVRPVVVDGAQHTKKTQTGITIEMAEEGKRGKAFLMDDEL